MVRGAKVEGGTNDEGRTWDHGRTKDDGRTKAQEPRPRDQVMHEYSIVQSLFDRIHEAARERGAVAVRRVRVQIGEIAGVDVELLRTAYDLFRVRTICENAPLDVDAVATRWTCPEGHGDITRGCALVCPDCSRPARLAAGDEIVLEQLELEVP